MSINTVCPTCGEPIPSDAPAGACPGCLLLLATEVGPDDADHPHQLRAPSIDKLQDFFPTYRIDALVGIGGQGVVYRAFEQAKGRQVALKVLSIEQSANPEFLSRFMLEAKTLANLSHPGIVGIHESGQAGDYFFIAMQWIEGLTLRELLRENPMDSHAAHKLILQICEALDYAHQQGVIHRDLKPENLLISDSGEVKIADFGIAKLLGEHTTSNVGLTATNTRLGTARYMAPEQMRGDAQIDARADVYALGVILFELLTGELPLPFGLPPSKIAGVSSTYDRIVARAMNPLPQDRFASVAEFAQQMRSASKTTSPKWSGAVAAIAACTFIVPMSLHWTRTTLFEVNLPPPAGVAAALTSEEWEWTEPENLGPVVNTPGNDHSPFISSDGLTLLYHGRGHEGLDNVDIWECQRASIDAPWGSPRNLGPMINSEHWEGDPCLSPDGLTLLYASDWRDSVGLIAMLESTRAGINAPWTEPRLLRLDQISLTDQDRGPSLSTDGLSVYFARGTTQQGYDLMITERSSLGKRFQQPRSLGAPVNTISIESDPTISADGLVLLWAAPFSPTPYDQEIWWTYRADTKSPWQPPRRLSSVISARGAAEPSLSSSGKEIYFSSARVMGSSGKKIEHYGGTDIYVSRLVRKANKSPLEAAANH